MATRFISHSADETEAFAENNVAPLLRPGDVIACRGGMGMGKTAFTRGLARGLGLADDVSSPTFALIHEYTHGNTPLFHFDMYRIFGIDELYSTGFFDYLGSDGIMLIEWSENIEDALPPETITLTISRGGGPQTGDPQTGDVQTGNAQTGDEHGGDAQTGDPQTGNAQTGGPQTDDPQTGNAQTGNARGDDNTRVLTLKGGLF